MKAKRVLGIDASTNSLAFALFDGGKPVACGEIKFVGSSTFERLRDAKHKIHALMANDYLKADYVAIESAIMVRNIQTAIDLAYVYGAIIGELMEANPQVHKVAPISWQTYYGVPNLKRHEKEQIQKDFPGKSKTWYQNKGREIRKQRILDRSKEFFPVHTNSDNVGDAIGIAYYAMHHLTR